MSNRQIVLDTETTGLNPKSGHRIIEIGAIEIINRRITDNHFHVYLNPERDIDEGALAVHGLTRTFLQDKPLFSGIAENFLAFVGGDELIIHNAAFDLKFLNHELHLLNQEHPLLEKTRKIMDTLMLARQKHPGQRNNLDALCKRYNIDTSKRVMHGALLDARLLALVYLAMTGGQSSLFDALHEDLKNKSSISVTNVDEIALDAIPVVKADESEVAAHNAYIEVLKKENRGVCVWD